MSSATSPEAATTGIDRLEPLIGSSVRDIGARPIWIWGAGRAGRLALDAIRRLGIEPAAFVDSAPAKHGTRVDGIAVRSPQELRQQLDRGTPFVLVASQFAGEIVNDARALGLVPGVDLAVFGGSLRPEDLPRSRRHACPFCDSEEASRERTLGDIVRCARCETVYLRTRLPQDTLYNLYQSYADEGSHIAIPRSVAEAQRHPLRREWFLDEVVSFVPRPGRLFDVGCGWGPFLTAARDRGFDVNGLEITQKAVEYANLHLRLPVVSGDFVKVNAPEGAFTVVTMLHVLEHLPDPRGALRKVHRLLEPGGMFCGIVPNYGSLCSIELGDAWFWLDPNYHYVHYTIDTLRRHLADAGFRIERLYTATGDYRREDLAAVARKRFPTEAASDLDGLIRRIEANGLGEEIRFFARKPA